MKLKTSLWLLAALVVSFGSARTVRADSCAWLDTSDQKFVYRSARRLLAVGAEFISFCKSCGEQPGPVQNVTTVQIAAPIMGESNPNAYRELLIDGKARDLSSLYVRTGARVFTNLALLVGCPATDLPPVLYTAPGRTPSPVSWEDVASARRAPTSFARN